MKWNRQSPCRNCPYRKDAPLGLWHPSEFDNLLETERLELGAVFACHGTRKHEDMGICAGWLLDQKTRGLPSIALRIQLIQSEEARACLKSVNTGDCELYSLQEMIAANEALGRCSRCGNYRQSEVCRCVFEILTDGRTVWVNGMRGLLGRFSHVGIDVHVDGQCQPDSCKPASGLEGWQEFQRLMKKHHAINVSDRFKPNFLKDHA